MTDGRAFREPLRVTLARTGAIAVGVGALIARPWAGNGGLERWALAAVVVLWPALGGHWVEVSYLNWVRRRLPVGGATRVGARLMVWFAGGVVLLWGMRLTVVVLAGDRGARWPGRWPAWWVGGLAFIAIELVTHAVLRASGRRSFFGGRG